MTIEEMKRRKKELGYSNAKVAELAHLPVGTVQKVFGGETKSPRYDTLRALELVLSSDSGRNMGLTAQEASAYGVQSNGFQRAHDRTGDKTINDYTALPEGTRVELIDGIFYDMAAPTTIHQFIAGRIFRELQDYVEKKKGKCIPFIAPTDVQIDCDDKSMLQPDVLVVCDRSKITRARIVGAPDFVVEIVSPGNATTDVYIKLIKYQMAGVREYWIVFPDEKRVVVYDFTKSSKPEIYTFDDSIPVAIWGGGCKVDFKRIYEQAAFIYELP
ncbi:MAG: Uma2 family endonuclease [Lachnospiraceae bacterium]|nr:Uma2 family endonuclease [Lachnospiraceae bacterium]